MSRHWPHLTWVTDWTAEHKRPSKPQISRTKGGGYTTWYYGRGPRRRLVLCTGSPCLRQAEIRITISGGLEFSSEKRQGRIVGTQDTE